MGSEANVRPDRGGFTLRTTQPQSAVERPVLGEFIEVVVRVPINRESATQDVWAVPDDYTHADIAHWIGEEYPSVCGFTADALDVPGAQVRVRLRARQGQDMLRDEMVTIWGGGTGGARTAS